LSGEELEHKAAARGEIGMDVQNKEDLRHELFSRRYACNFPVKIPFLFVSFSRL
jgi:hypothetical protein